MRTMSGLHDRNGLENLLQQLTHSSLRFCQKPIVIIHLQKRLINTLKVFCYLPLVFRHSSMIFPYLPLRLIQTRLRCRHLICNVGIKPHKGF